MVYNAHTVLKDQYSYEEIRWMPLRDCFDAVDFITPKLQEIARRQESEKIEAELTGKANMKRPGGRKQL